MAEGVNTIIESPKISIEIEGSDKKYSPDMTPDSGGGIIRLTNMGTFETEEEEDEDYGW